MDKFTTLTGIAAPLPLINVDTDMIIPKQFLKTIQRSGLPSARDHCSAAALRPGRCADGSSGGSRWTRHL